jgi:hypothetical protein
MYAMAQAINRRPLTAEVRVESQARSCGISGGQAGHWDRFISQQSGYRLSIALQR